MSGTQKRSQAPFVRKLKQVSRNGVGARWWNDALDEAVDKNRRAAMIALGVGGGVAALVTVGIASSGNDDDDIESNLDTLDLQRKTSWNVGSTDRALTYGGATRLDVDGGPAWQASLIDGHLDEALRPTDIRLQPYYVPTLFQAPAAAAGQGLNATLSPIFTPAMDVAFQRGQALATLLKVSDSPSDVGIIVDLPGPEAVAMSAGMSAQYAPVFVFVNWPHPLGVVPSHLTLGAALYYLPLLRRMDQVRPIHALPAFILDANRLAPYRDEATQFDNRYVANLPSVESLRALGIARLMYVRPDGDSLQELDDLNNEFTAFEQAGMDVRGVALADFRPAEPTARPASDAGAPPASAVHSSAHYYWGGSYGSHVYFWSYYGWVGPGPSPRVARPPVVSVSRASTYRPTPRPTMFSTRTMGGAPGVGKQKPSGFGRVSVRTARGSGAITGVAAGRTGSFGRSRFSSGG